MRNIHHLNSNNLVPNDPKEDLIMTNNTAEKSLTPNINVITFHQHNSKKRKDNFADCGLQNIITDLNNKISNISNEKLTENNGTNPKVKNINAEMKDLRLLVVEDDKPSQKVIHLMLRELGYKNIEIVETGLSAIEAINRNKYDLIILDIGLPDIDGLNISKEMRKSVENSKTAIIAITAFSRDEIEEKCYSSGINDVITKPIFIDELKNVLESWTDL